jgi:hypothetical protein
MRRLAARLTHPIIQPHEAQPISPTSTFRNVYILGYFAAWRLECRASSCTSPTNRFIISPGCGPRPTVTPGGRRFVGAVIMVGSRSAMAKTAVFPVCHPNLAGLVCALRIQPDSPVRDRAGRRGRLVKTPPDACRASFFHDLGAEQDGRNPLFSQRVPHARGATEGIT